MCIFTGSVLSVANTRIYASRRGEDQILVYEMDFAAKQDMAIALPLPDRNTEEDPAVFLDLQDKPRFFEALARLFKPRYKPGDPRPASKSPSSILAVKRVGAFDASYVPFPKDFSRLDARFRLGDPLMKALEPYRDFGFAVFKLRAGGRRRVHPFGIRFRSRYSEALYFPTLHVHDGEFHTRARYDHLLYAQVPEDWSSLKGWTRSLRTPVRTRLPKPIVDKQAPVFARYLRGTKKNTDLYVLDNGRELRCVG